LRRWCRTRSRACAATSAASGLLRRCCRRAKPFRRCAPRGDDVDDAIQAGALRILDSARLKGLDVVQLWLEEEERALAEGYNGLRIAGDTRFLTAGDWSTFMEYEHAVTARCNGRRIVTLCSCALAQGNDQQMSEVMHAHHCALERLDADWQVFAVPKFLGSFESRW